MALGITILGKIMNLKWTETEKNYIRDNAHLKKDQEEAYNVLVKPINLVLKQNICQPPNKNYKLKK